MSHITDYPQPPDETGRLEGVAYDLRLPPDDAPAPAVVILHGSGSRKENHADYARMAAAHGCVALTFDARGHGESEGKLGPGVIVDIERLARLLAERPEVDQRRIAVRGSSMGGLLAIHAGAAIERVAAVVAICPASEALMIDDVRRLARGERLDESGLDPDRVDAPALAAWLEEHDVREAAALMGDKPMMLVHARGDEVVPYTISEQIHERASEPKRLLLTEGGHHRSLQHDAEIQGETLRWLVKAMARSGA